MKDATGELNMTVVTVVAIAAIAAVFYLWVWPSIQVSIAKSTCKASCNLASGGNCDSITKSEIETKKDTFDATSYCTGTAGGSTP